MDSNNVINEFKVKGSNGADVSYPIGPELRYIGSLSSSNNNNLEEQMLIDVDKITTSYHDNTLKAQVTETEYRNSNKNSNYYILKKIIQDNSSTYSTKDGGNYTINNYSDDIYTIDGLGQLTFKNEDDNLNVDNDKLKQINYDSHMIAKQESENEYILSLKAVGVLEKDELQYKGESGDPILISSKEIKQEPIDNKIVITETIIKIDS